MIISSMILTVLTPQEVARLYIADFKRAPDRAGLDYWIYKSNLSLEGIATIFYEQPEMKEKYGNLRDNTLYIKSA